MPTSRAQSEVTLSIAIAHYRLHCGYCKRFSAKGGTKNQAIEKWNTRAREAALIALVQEAAGEIERLKQWEAVALAIGERAEQELKERELEGEAADGQD
jgi:hypothetical protein